MVKFSEHIKANESDAFSIILPTWNNLDYLQLCIKSLRKNSSYKNQIIVAVNEGSDGTLEWLKEQDDIDFVHATENMGVCYAVNACRPHAKTDYIVYMNDDMYVCPEWDKELLKEIKSLNTDYFFLSSSIIEPIKNSNPNYVAHIKDYGTTPKNFNEDTLLLEYASLPINNWLGSSWPPNVVHKKLWDAVGGYSIEFSPGMYSDPDFSMKLWHAGVRKFYGVGKSRVYHFGERSTGRIKKNKGADTFLSKWGMSARSYYSEHLMIGKEEFFNYPNQIQLSWHSRLRNTGKLLFNALFRTF